MKLNLTVRLELSTSIVRQQPSRREAFLEFFLHLKSHAPTPRTSHEVAGSTEPLLGFARMIQVRHRSHATYSRQPRQVRKEATVTGSCVCSESPVPGLLDISSRLDPNFTHPYNSLRKNSLFRSSHK
jgi:hypothetical protein